MTTSRAKRAIVTRNGKQFALVELNELRRLESLAAKVDSDAIELAPLPIADAQGNRPAVAFARASLARSIRQERLAAGLTQQELALAAGVRQETISRLESGKHSPTVRMVEKIDRALQSAARKRSASKRRT
jgi:DNA-binding XRE family transcriptional regulator